MIAADHILINGDTAWWVMGNEAYRTVNEIIDGEIVPLDRPCDTCDTIAPPGECGRCIDGRHTFDIEVVRPIHSHETDDGGWDQLDEITRYRVSVVPGMVLPILGEDDSSPHPPGPAYIRLNRSGRAFHLTPFESHEIALPPAAAPGMWAVKLAVH